MRFRPGSMTAVAALVLLAADPARAVDYAAAGSGDWSTAGTWTPNGIPGASDNASIGTSSVPTATVTLTADAAISNLYVGDSGSTSGTLALGGFNLAAGTIYLGWYGPTGAIDNSVSGSSITATNLYINNGNSYSFGTSDVVSYLNLSGSSSATTAATGNLTGIVDVNSGTLNLGAALSLNNTFYVENGGVVNAAGHDITVTGGGSIFLGWYGTAGEWTLNNPGNLTASSLYVNGGSFNLTATDSIGGFILENSATTSFIAGASVTNLTLDSGAQATTTATGNVTGAVDVNDGTLNMGAALNLNGNFYIENGGVVNAAGHDITVTNGGAIFLGWYGTPGAWTLNNPGTLTASDLYVNGGSFGLSTADAFTNFHLENGAQVTTAAVGNVTGSVDVTNNNATSGTPSTLTLGAALNISGNLTIEDGGVVNAAGNAITVTNGSSIFLGWYGTAGAWTLDNPGVLTASSLYVNGGSFDLRPTDSIGSFILENSATTSFVSGASVTNLTLDSGAQATTTATGNVTGTVDVNGGTLNMGAALNLNGNFYVENGGVVNAAGHDITVTNGGAIFLGWYGTPGAWTLNNPGTLTASDLYVNGGSFGLSTADAFTNFHLENGAQVTTAAVGNVTGSVDVTNNNATSGTPSTLILGAALNLSGNLTVENGGVVNGNGHGITANSVFVGWYGNMAGTINNVGPLVATNLYMNYASSMTITGGTLAYMNLEGNSILTVQQAAGQTTGLTFTGGSSDLIFDPSSIDLIFSANMGIDWAFRWQDPATGGNWISEIDALIASGNIVISSPYGYSVYDSGGYTYVGYDNTAVPEPSSLALCGLGVAFIGLRAWRRRKSA